MGHFRNLDPILVRVKPQMANQVGNTSAKDRKLVRLKPQVNSRALVHPIFGVLQRPDSYHSAPFQQVDFPLPCWPTGVYMLAHIPYVLVQKCVQSQYTQRNYGVNIQNCCILWVFNSQTDPNGLRPVSHLNHMSAWHPHSIPLGLALYQWSLIGDHRNR